MSAAIGIDFGTTNSALAWAERADAVAHVATFDVAGSPAAGALTGPAARAGTTFRSILFFAAERERVRGKPEAWAGPAAIEAYLANDGDGRLMQSMKTFLASQHVRGTNVFGYDFALEALIALIIRALWLASVGQVPGLSATTAGAAGLPAIVAGRPVRFANSDGPEDDAYAEGRLRAAYAAAGFREVEFVLEPVAAALHYEAGLERDETVLVGDFGGGTSDFCLLRVGPSYRAGGGAEVGDRGRILGTRGVGVAGDNLDARIVQHLVAPALGAGSMYRSDMGNVLEIPRGIFDKLRRWNELSFLKTRQNMEMLLGYLRAAREPKKIGALVHLVEHNLGYRLFRAVEAAKVSLSQAPEAELAFDDEGFAVQQRFTRADFEGWIAPELGALGGTVDALLADAGMGPEAVDTVFLTGGTGQVPAVRRLFAERFGEHKLRTGQFLTSIASGLALHARRRDAGRA